MSRQIAGGAKRVERGGLARGFWAELKTNRRALAGVLAVALLVLGYGLLQFNDAIDGKRSLYRHEASQLQRTVALGAEKNWPARAKESTATRQALEGRLWKFESEGVALANFQDWVTAAARDAGLGRLQVKIDVAHPKDMPANFRQLTATVVAVPKEESLIAFLDRIQREPHLLVVDALHVQQQPAPTLQMTLLTFAILGGAQGLPAK